MSQPHFAAEPTDLLRDALLSVAVILNVSIALLIGWISPASPVYALFPAAAGVLLILMGRYSPAVVLIVVTLFFYTSLIVLANGIGSLRLGVGSAVLLGLLYASARTRPWALWVGSLCVFAVLFNSTEGLTRPLWGPLADGMSYNYFGGAMCDLLLASMIGGSRYRSVPYFAFAILVMAILTGMLVPSRQTILVAAFAGVYLIMLTRPRPITVVTALAAFVIAAFLYGFAEFAVLERMMAEPLESARTQILNCYVKEVSVTDLLIGSDHTVSGACALKLVGVKYLHDGYLVTIGELGLLALFLLVMFPCAIVYFAVKKDQDMVLALTLAGVYQFAEGGMMWVFFMVLFKLLQQAGGVRLSADRVHSLRLLLRAPS